MTAPAILRAAAATDVDGLRDLYVAAWTATYATTLGPSVLAAMLADLRDSGMRCMLPGNDERAIVAVGDGVVIGSAILAERRSVAYLWGMYVSPAHQRRGIGSALLRHAARSLAPGVCIEARVLPSSPWAIAFYTRHGFRETGREPLEVAPGHRVDAIVMSVAGDALPPS